MNEPPEIALIDSGVNPWHPHVMGIEGGQGFQLDSAGNVEQTTDFIDNLGHGTALAGIIRQKASEARIHALKIFHDDLNAPISLLLAALKWAVDRRVNIINLSLGTERLEYRDELEDLCQKASDRGIVIVAAARHPGDRVFPSSFPTVIGVYWNRQCAKNEIVRHPGCRVEFGTYGRPRAIPGLPPEQNFCGNSFAAAHVTGTMAQVLWNHPGQGIPAIKQILMKASTV